MTDFLTVEDINSILKEYGNVSIFHEINTSDIQSENDYTNVVYDFCKVSRETSGNNYIFSFEIVNAIWTGGYYFLDNNGGYIDTDATYDSINNILSITTNSENVTLCLYLHNIATNFNIQRLVWKPTPLYNILQNDTGLRIYNKKIYLTALKEGVEFTGNVVCSYGTTQTNKSILTDGNGQYVNYTGIGVVKITYSNNDFYYIVEKTKTVFPLYLEYNPINEGGFTINTFLINGKVNKVHYLFVNEERELNGGTAIIEYNNIKEEITIDNHTRNRKFQIDLTKKTDLTPINLKFTLNGIDGDYGYEYYFVLPCNYVQIENINDLIGECGAGGTSIIELSSNLQLTSNITITHDIKINGNGKTIDLNGHGFILNEGVTVILENIHFNNGDTAITQQKNTNLTLTNCTFNHCTSTQYNNLGSCVYCDVDIESLNTQNDFNTLIENCTFTDNHNAIFHGGLLTVKNSKYHNTDLNYADKHNVAFLYQTDGVANLTSNIFDIDYTATTLCTNQQSIGYGQALIQCGMTASINGANATQLSKDNSLPFDMNASHVFAKYYYPQIEDCVYISPEQSFEDKSLCYTVTGTNWIFKQNAQVTRASWDTQNQIRKITWG